MEMPAPDASVIARRDEIVAALRRIVPGEGVIVSEPERRAYESDGLTAYRQMPLAVVLPSTVDAGRRGAALLPGRADQGGAARRRHVIVGRRLAAGRRRPARHGQVQPHSRHRLRQPVRRRAAGRHQSRHQPCGCRARFLLRARPVEPDRLHDRRQCRREFGRRALPEIRADDEQPARPRSGADRRRNRPARRQASRYRRLRFDGDHDRLRGAARGRHRSYRAHPAETVDRAGAADRLRRRPRMPEAVSPRSSAPASSRAAWR